MPWLPSQLSTDLANPSITDSVTGRLTTELPKMTVTLDGLVSRLTSLNMTGLTTVLDAFANDTNALAADFDRFQTNLLQLSNKTVSYSFLMLLLFYCAIIIVIGVVAFINTIVFRISTNHFNTARKSRLGTEIQVSDRNEVPEVMQHKSCLLRATVWIIVVVQCLGVTGVPFVKANW